MTALLQDIGIAVAVAFTFLLAGPFLLLVVPRWLRSRVLDVRVWLGSRQWRPVRTRKRRRRQAVRQAKATAYDWGEMTRSEYVEWRRISEWRGREMAKTEVKR
jgi:hypothetical protein